MTGWMLDAWGWVATHQHTALFWTIYALRCVSMVFCAYNMAWSARDFFGYLSMSRNSTQVYRAFVFSASFSIFSFGLSFVSFFVTINADAWSLFNVLMVFAVSLIGVHGRILNERLKTDELFAVLPFINYLLPLAELAKRDRASADFIARAVEERLEELRGQDK